MHSLEHAFNDSLKILPFLFITYLIMEVLEKKAGKKTSLWLKKAIRNWMLPVEVVCLDNMAFSMVQSTRILIEFFPWMIDLHTESEIRKKSLF